MKNYIRPSVEVSKFDVADIITASGDVVNASTFVKDTVEYDMYQEYLAADGTEAKAAIFQW
jgi:hypothetical protein